MCIGLVGFVLGVLAGRGDWYRMQQFLGCFVSVMFTHLRGYMPFVNVGVFPLESESMISGVMDLYPYPYPGGISSLGDIVGDGAGAFANLSSFWV